MSEKTTKELVLEGRDEGKVVWLQHDGGGFAVMSAPTKEFIRQPADGILYDLNRLEEIALTYIDDPKWVNDFAVALTIRALKEERDALLAGLRESNAQLEHLVAWLESDLSALNKRELIEAVDRIAGDALAALPEYLRGESDE